MIALIEQDWARQGESCSLLPALSPHMESDSCMLSAAQGIWGRWKHAGEVVADGKGRKSTVLSGADKGW